MKSFIEWASKHNEDFNISNPWDTEPYTSTVDAAAKQNQAKTIYEKFTNLIDNLPQAQWEIYLNDLTSKYQEKFGKNLSQVQQVNKGTSANMMSAQRKIDAQRRDVPTPGGTQTGMAMQQT